MEQCVESSLWVSSEWSKTQSEGTEGCDTEKWLATDHAQEQGNAADWIKQLVSPKF